MAGRFRTFVLSALLSGCFWPSVAAAQQPLPADAGCMQHKGEYTCNWISLQSAFDRSRTIALRTEPMDRSTAAQLRRLIAELGKVPAAEGQPADLTFAVVPVPPNGVDMGPNDHELARLLIYAPSQASAQGLLLWAETYRGQGDRPWPAQVHALLRQFQERFPGKS